MTTPQTFQIVLVEEDTKQQHLVQATRGEKITQLASRANLVIQQTCGGTPSCTDCVVTIEEGLKDGLLAPEGAELRLMGNVSHITKQRLSCQAIVCGPCRIVIPNAKLIQKKRSEKRQP